MDGQPDVEPPKNEPDYSLEGIEARLGLIHVEDLIVLALEFDESPMRYFSEPDLKQLNYTKRHYISQLGHAFFENPHRLDYLLRFEKSIKEKALKKVEASAALLQAPVQGAPQNKGRRMSFMPANNKPLISTKFDKSNHDVTNTAGSPNPNPAAKGDFLFC